ncbi:MAG: late competence development ComFB family protein [Symploca sp. SIO2E9]|nr:late competence development ComFB family protein [Symploca sp. SIO2E9]
MHSNQVQTLKNAMELLVIEEVERQLDNYPQHLANYINPVEVATYAVNRLPPLYASSEEGWRQQKLRGKREFKNQINTAVRQGFAAVQRDPLRVSTPLISEDTLEAEAAKAALQDIRTLLKSKEVSWKNLVSFVRKALTTTAYTEVSKYQIEKLLDPSCVWNDYRSQK